MANKAKDVFKSVPCIFAYSNALTDNCTEFYLINNPQCQEFEYEQYNNDRAWAHFAVANTKKEDTNVQATLTKWFHNNDKTDLSDSQLSTLQYLQI